jgi:hypothetical protein
MRHAVVLGCLLVLGCGPSFEATEEGDPVLAARDGYTARLLPDGFAIGGLDRPPVHIATAAIEQGGVSLIDGDARPATPTRLLGAGVEERFEARDEGIEVSWAFAARPEGEGDVIVRLVLEGATAALQDDSGWHFVAGDEGIRVAPATWIDANGERVAIEARAEGGVLELIVPSDVVASSAFPAVLDPVIGPEVPVDLPAAIVGSPYFASNPSVAFDGTNYLVVWSEDRDFASFEVSVMAVRVRATDGAILDPGGIVVADTTSSSPPAPDVAFDGSRFLVVWNTANNLYFRGVGVDGTVLGSGPTALSTATGTQSDVHIACGAGSCIAAWNDGRTSPASTIAARIDGATGTVLDPLGVILAPASGDVEITHSGSEYLVAWANATGVRATRVNATTGAPIDTTPIAVFTGTTSSLALAYTSGTYMMSWQSSTNALGARVRASDGVVLDTTPITLSPSTATELRHHVTAVDAGFLGAWDVSNGTDSDVRGAIVRSSDGSLVDPSGLLIAGGTGSQQDVALSTGTGQVLAVWVTSGALWAQRIGTADHLPMGSPFRVSTVVNQQVGPAAASDGTDHFVVWRDSRSGGAVYGARVRDDGSAIDAPAFRISDAAAVPGDLAVGYGAGQYLVVWADQRGSSSALYGARVRASDGSVVDATSFLVFAAAGTEAGPSVAFDGTNFLVTWDDSRGTPLMVSVRPSDATVINPLGAPLASISARYPSIACHPSLCVAAWVTSSSVRAVRISAGTVLDTTPASLGGSTTRPSVASDGTNFGVAWRSTSTEIGARIVRADGTLGLASSATAGSMVSSAMGYRDGAYVVPWVLVGRVGVTQLRSDGSVSSISSVSTPTVTTSIVAVSTSATGTLIAYDWPDTRSPAFGGWRVRLRAIDTGRALGSACTFSSECGSNFCVDGVCCNTACAGGTTDCQACSVAAGAAADGTCSIAAAGSVCRAGATSCDAVEVCNGTSSACPVDARSPAGTVCRPAAGDCDLPETCSGTGATCPTDRFVSSGTTCRPVAGDCDVIDRCSGTSAACPDAVRASSTVCRAAGGACDVAERCDGIAGACPADAVTPAATVCRPSSGTCDLTETCDGAAVACPTDAFEAAGTVCRPSVGECDLTESCSGSAGTCPPELSTAEIVCRPAAGPCDLRERCSVSSPTCPPDRSASDGMSCADAVACNGAETCSAGACVPGTVLDCDDGDPCTADGCAEPGGCSHDPIAGCASPDAGQDSGSPDAGAPDGGGEDVGSLDAGVPADAPLGMDAGVSPSAGGCACHVGQRDGWTPWALLVLATVIVRRRARAVRPNGGEARR